jgi:hypothetical protein
MSGGENGEASILRNNAIPAMAASLAISKPGSPIDLQIRSDHCQLDPPPGPSSRAACLAGFLRLLLEGVEHKDQAVYESIKPGPSGSVSLMLTPLELIGRLAALIPPPRRHRHRYYGVLAPNAPLRGQVTALAGVPDGTPAADVTGSIAATTAPSRSSEGTAEAILRRAARYAWALLLARIYEVFPLVCPRCGGEMRIIAFINDAGAVREILTHLGEPTSPPRLMKARAPPLWEMQGANMGEDEAQAQSAPEYQFDQRVAW